MKVGVVAGLAVVVGLVLFLSGPGPEPRMAYEAGVVEQKCGLSDGLLDPTPSQKAEVSPSITAIKFTPEGKSKPIFTYYDGGGGADGYSVACDGTRFGDAVYDVDRGVIVRSDGTTGP